MTRPLLLDLFCCEGGAAAGYHLAGFDVIGVDIVPQPRYPFPMVVADALAPPFDLTRFDAIHASPPCQAFTQMRTTHSGSDYADRHEDLLEPTRELLRASGRPYVIENVIGAPLLNPTLLCGSSFGLRVRRHRLFESNTLLLSSGCAHGQQRSADLVGLFGNFGPDKQFGAGGCTLEEARVILSMPWASRYGIAQSVPPEYTAHLGRQLIEAL